MGRGGAPSVLKQIDPHTFSVNAQHDPVILAFLKPNARSRKLALVLEEAVTLFGQHVACYMVGADYLKSGMTLFDVDGTPTLLCLREGVEVDRLMGEADPDTMDQFLRSCITPVVL